MGIDENEAEFEDPPVDSSSLLAEYLRQRTISNEDHHQVPFDYEDVTLSDDTQQIVTLLRQLTSDMDDVLTSISISQESKENESKINQEDENESKIPFDPNWERSICHSEKWGSYKNISKSHLKLRGATYLTDRIKIESRSTLLSLAKVDIFSSKIPKYHFAQHKKSWFYQNKLKLPRSLFFIIIHLRLDSVQIGCTLYFYIDRNKYKHLLKNEKCKRILAQKGNGFFPIGSSYASGMFWNFINGSCKYRNDRLKMMARKEEGPFYFYVPTTPTIIGKKVPIRYFRSYEQKYLNSTKVHRTKSEQYKSYKFKTLYHDAKKSNIEIPCACGKCEWIDNKGQYADYLEIDISPEVNPIAAATIKMASLLTKSLQIEMHWTLEGQRNNIELPERMLCSARLKYVDLERVDKIK